MTRYLLDTNIVSEAIKPHPSEHLTNWMMERRSVELFISAFTVAEIWRGILEKPKGKKRSLLEAWFVGEDGPPKLFFGRILPFDNAAALVWARLMADGTQAGRPRSALDMVIAAIALSNDCVLVTNNERDFGGLDLINPLRP